MHVRPSAESSDGRSVDVASAMLSKRIYLGTMNFAWPQASTFVDSGIATEMLRRFGAAGGRRLDTARIYAGGDTEPMLREALAGGGEYGWLLGTKAHPSQTDGLSEAGLEAQLAASRAAIGVSSAGWHT